MEGCRVRRNIAWICVLAIAGGCSHHSPFISRDVGAPPPALSARAVQHSQITTATLDVQTVTSGALDAASLEQLLSRGHFLNGTRRTFVRTGNPLDRVDTRILAFGLTSGAAIYVRWVASHPADLIGDAKGAAPLDAPGSPQVFVHVPNGCCPKDVAKSLAVWQRHRYVLLVIANGGMTKQKTLTDLAAQLDGLV
jgi:hypothetical protein